MDNWENLDRIKHDILEREAPALYRWVRMVVRKTRSLSYATGKVRRMDMTSIPELRRGVTIEVMEGAVRHLFKLKRSERESV